MNCAVVAARNVKNAVAIHGQARGIHQLGDEWFDSVVGRDFVKRHGNFLAALAAEGDVDVSPAIYGRIRDGMQIVGDQLAESDGKRRACGVARLHADGAAFGAIGNARDEDILGSQNQASRRRAEVNLRAQLISVDEARAVDRDFAAGDCR